MGCFHKHPIPTKPNNSNYGKQFLRPLKGIKPQRFLLKNADAEPINLVLCALIIQTNFLSRT